MMPIWKQIPRDFCRKNILENTDRYSSLTIRVWLWFVTTFLLFAIFLSFFLSQSLSLSLYMMTWYESGKTFALYIFQNNNICTYRVVWTAALEVIFFICIWSLKVSVLKTTFQSSMLTTEEWKRKNIAIGNVTRWIMTHDKNP